MKFQEDISNMNTHIHTYIRTSRNQYVPHFFKVGGIIISGSGFCYSKTCLGRPLLGRTKCGLSRQVVSEARESR